MTVTTRTLQDAYDEACRLLGDLTVRLSFTEQLVGKDSDHEEKEKDA